MHHQCFSTVFCYEDGVFIQDLNPTGSATAKKYVDTYNYISDRNFVGSKPLNVGEEDALRCYKATPYDKSGFCKSVGDKARYDYHHPWKSKKK